MSETSFQYFSDIHLELYNENQPKINRMFIDKIKRQEQRAKYLLIPGDIGKPTSSSYQEFLASLSFLYDKIFVTTGNHEYYSMPFDSTTKLDNYCRDICLNVPNKNVFFLQNEVYAISETLSIFGGTFWTNIPQTKYSLVSNCINDYAKIPLFTPQTSCALHEQAIFLLQSHIERNDKKRWIVMSHHMPSYSLIDSKYLTLAYNDINCAFASDIATATDSKIIAWVYGHTHLPSVVGKYYCNPIGYPGENNNWSLDKSFTVAS